MSALTQIQVPDGTTYEFKDSGALRAAAAAPAFSASTAYAVGDAVTKDGLVYRCTTAHNGAWNAEHFAALDPIQSQLDAADPRYALVASLDTAPTNQWVYTWDGHLTSYSADFYDFTASFSNGVWTFTDVNGGTGGSYTVSGPSDAASLTFTAQDYDGDDRTVAATRVSAIQLQDRAVQLLTLSAATTTVVFPSPQAGKTSDFAVDVYNSANVDATVDFSGVLGTDWNVVIPEGETLSEMMTFEAGARAVLYFTLSAFAIGSKPTWEVTRRTVEAASAG